MKLRIVWGDDQSGRFHGQTFYEKLRSADKAKFEPLFGRLSDTGEIKNIQKFRKEGSAGIFAFKVHKQRLFGFLDGGDFVIVSGMTKKSDKGKRFNREIVRAEKLMKEHLKEAAK